MDVSFTYGNPTGAHATLYVAQQFEGPDSITLTLDGKELEFLRLSDRSLTCDATHGVPGKCESIDCHRRVLGECQCGRHAAPVRFARATS
ncbi:hypothetical protein [Cryobacterium cryoconiti]|uniref:Uncharacterized protein n=1 Tax=Cryobacterium cryoconiti TaxID=1259239 RepID=A0A4Y8JRE0_9MICO|nr:hypothetical protein [Cryobacterium cryoconiti]TFD27488.1 hypothetical protein E3T49_13165 [Cryobacterium cryoconiti]